MDRTPELGDEILIFNVNADGDAYVGPFHGTIVKVTDGSNTIDAKCTDDGKTFVQHDIGLKPATGFACYFEYPADPPAEKLDEVVTEKAAG